MGFGRLQSLCKSEEQLISPLATLSKEGWVAWPDFFEAQADMVALCNDLDDRFASGEMREAGVKGPRAAGPVAYHGAQQRTVLTAVRKTATCWLDYALPKSEIEAKLLQYVDAFRMQLGERLGYSFDFEDMEVLYARYPEGGYYKRHSDSHAPGAGVAARDTERTLSFILYLNQSGWTAGDGGELRLHGPLLQNWPHHIDVAPTPGTLLLFFSRDFEHEVLETRVSRRAIVGWFRVRAPAPPPLFLFEQ